MGKRKSDTLSDDNTQLASKKARPSDSVNHINALDRNAFLQRTNIDFKYTTRTSVTYSADLKYAGNLAKEDLQTCFKLLESTSRHDYEPSSFGWHPKRKLREMGEEEMRYLLISGASSSFSGFVSFMFTHDSSPVVPVLYVYELHLVEEARGCGLGKYLMFCLESLARSFGMEKVMLTCFKSNTNAYTFYESLGYAVDACSPKHIKTRKKVSQSDYAIMSLDLSDRLQTSHSVGVVDNKPTQVTRDAEATSADPADVFPSQAEYDQSLGRCHDELVYGFELFDVATDKVTEIIKAIVEGDEYATHLEATHLATLIQRIRIRAGLHFALNSESRLQMRYVERLLDKVVHKADGSPVTLPDKLHGSMSDLQAELSNPSSGMEHFTASGSSDKIATAHAEERMRLNSREQALTKREAAASRGMELVRIKARQLEEREGRISAALRVHNESLSKAKERVHSRSRELDAREAQIRLTIEKLAEGFPDDDDSENDFDEESEDDPEDSEEADEEEEEVAESNTDYSGGDDSGNNILDSDSEDVKTKRPAKSNAFKLPTPEAMKRRRPRKDKVSSWLRRSGSARESFPRDF